MRALNDTKEKAGMRFHFSGNRGKIIPKTSLWPEMHVLLPYGRLFLYGICSLDHWIYPRSVHIRFFLFPVK